MPCGMILSDSWKSANRAKMVLLGTISGFQESGSIPIRSFTAPRRRCLQPRYFSVVCTDTTNVRLAAVRRLADEAADAGLLSPELAAGIRRVKGSQEVGRSIGELVNRGFKPAPSGSSRTPER